jgi:peptide-methionine (R)-S-oxide reductase
MKAIHLRVAFALTLAVSLHAEDPKPQPTPPKETPVKEIKSEDDWRTLLTDEQFRVTRQAGTERPDGPEYEKFNKQGEGTYYCVCCAAELFTSSEKFHSGCGWPSFYDQSKAKNVTERVDNSGGMRRVETVCTKCDAHLGHVFDGEALSASTPTNRRFCINGVALTFVEKGGKPPLPKGKPAEAAAKPEEKK